MYVLYVYARGACGVQKYDTKCWAYGILRYVVKYWNRKYQTFDISIERLSPLQPLPPPLHCYIPGMLISYTWYMIVSPLYTDCRNSCMRPVRAIEVITHSHTRLAKMSFDQILESPSRCFSNFVSIRSMYVSNRFLLVPRRRIEIIINNVVGIAYVVVVVVVVVVVLALPHAQNMESVNTRRAPKHSSGRIPQAGASVKKIKRHTTPPPEVGTENRYNQSL